MGYGGRIETTTPDQVIAGRWQLRALLGRGAMADVHDAVDVVTGLPVAVKVLRSVESEHLQRFERELNALRTLDHPAVVALLDHGEHNGSPFLVLERCDGGTLAEALVDGPVGPERASSVGAELADGLAHAHARGVVHRDVKPSNVLLCADGTAKLADFGIARLHDASALTGTGFTVGTAAYLAPEQARGEAVGPSADVYSLGLVVLEMATGRRAFEGVGMAAAMARLHHGPDIPEDLPLGLAATITAMSAMDAADRPTAEAVASRLRQPAVADDGDGTAVLPIVGDPTVVIPAVEAGTDPGRTRSPWFAMSTWPRWALPVACFAVGFLAVLLLGIALAGGGGGDAPTTTTTTVPTTTATTAPPPTTTTPPPPEDEEGEGRGNGNGNGRGDRGDRGDDD